jgi:hypothetical protein
MDSPPGQDAPINETDVHPRTKESPQPPGARGEPQERAEATSGERVDRVRFPSERKMEAVIRLLRAEDIDAPAPEAASRLPRSGSRARNSWPQASPD